MCFINVVDLLDLHQAALGGDWVTLRSAGLRDLPDKPGLAMGVRVLVALLYLARGYWELKPKIEGQRDYNTTMWWLCLGQSSGLQKQVAYDDLDLQKLTAYSIPFL